MSYRIFTDSASNLIGECAVPGIEIIPFTYSLGGEEIVVGTETREKHLELFRKMREKVPVTTSQINGSAFHDAFEPALKAGEDLLYVGIAGGISGTLNQARLAAEELAEQYPDRKIHIIDSKNAGFGEALPALAALKNKEAGMSYDENVAATETIVPHARGVFVVDDLKFLASTGRVSKFKALTGTMLGIKPLLYGDETGHIVVRNTVRGKRAALDQLAKEFEEHVLPEKQVIYIAHCDAEKDAEYLRDALRSHPSVLSIRIGLHEPMSASHLGPGSVALFYLADCR